MPLAGAGRTGLWVAPPPPTGGDEGRGRRLWEAVGEALWTRYTSGEAIAAARGALALRDAQIALHAAAAEAGEPQAVLTRLLDALARAGGADRALLHTTGPRGRRIAGAGAALSRPGRRGRRGAGGETRRRRGRGGRSGASSGSTRRSCARSASAR